MRYRKDPQRQNSKRKLTLTLTLVLTLTDTGGAVLTVMLGYRSLYITVNDYSGYLRQRTVTKSAHSRTSL